MADDRTLTMDRRLVVLTATLAALAGNHVNVAMASRWAIVGKPAPSYDPATKVCANTYCHSDGTNGTPELDIYTDSFSLVGSLTPACRA